jgi:hypothetical protein
MTQHLFKFLIVTLLALLCSLARADIVTLKDGTIIEGVVVKENGAQVVIEVTIANIKTTKTYPRYKVKSIEYKPVEPEEADIKHGEESKQSDDGQADKETTHTPRRSTTRATRKRSPRASANSKTRYIVIPVHGTIGEETNAVGLERALSQASKKQVEHVVFEIDSPGGFVYDAVETLKVLKKYDEAFNFHALVDGGAISASSVYVAAADDIWVRPDARVGGAVAYSKENSSGAAEVDAKFNSIWAAEIAARADSKGYPGEIFRAMVVLEAEVWMDSEGEVTSSRPAGNAQQIDSNSTILTIRASQMVKAGMAKEFTGEIRELGTALNVENWIEIKGIGLRAMGDSAKERIALSERIDFATKIYDEASKELDQDHPAKFNDYRVYMRRLLDPSDFTGNRRSNNYESADAQDAESINKWRDRSRAAIKDLDRMIEALTELASVNRRAERVGALHLMMSKNYGEKTYQNALKERDWLARNMNKIPFTTDGKIDYQP